MFERMYLSNANLFFRLLFLRKKLKITILFILLSFCSIHLSYSDQQKIIFDCLTLEQGLSQSTVTSVIQDQIGYMWFGTIDGLNKFDGYNFTVYKNNPSDSTSLASDWITTLYLEQNGKLWIGTINQGLACFDAKCGEFRHYRYNPIPVNSPARRQVIADLPFTFSYLNNFTIKAISEDINGNIWIGTFGSGLYKFDVDTEEFIHYPFADDITNGLAYNIMSLCKTDIGNKTILWIGTYGGGLVKFNESDGFTYYKMQSNDNPGLADNRIVALYADCCPHKNTLWIGSFGGGLQQFDIDTEKFITYRHNAKKRNSLSSNYVLSLLKDRCGELWIGTYDNGLNKLDIEKNEFTHYQHDPMNLSTLGSNEVLSLFEDRSGVVWIGTNFGYGINKFNRGKNKFAHYYHDPRNDNSLSDNVVFAVCEDKNGFIWIGTFQNGITRIDRDNNKYTHYRYDKNNPHGINDSHIRTIFEDSKDRLWIGSFSGGLIYLDRENEKFYHYMNDPSDSTSICGNQVRTIYEHTDNMLWVGAFGRGLNKFDPSTGKFLRFQHDPSDSCSLGDNRVYYITQFKKNLLWIATFGGGLDLFDIATEKFKHFKHDEMNSNSLSSDQVLTVYIDQSNDDIVWIGTYGGGLNKLNMRDNTFTHFTEEDGLSNNVVYSILPDEDGFLWMSTNKGISKFDPKTNAFIKYDISDGLQSNEFNAGAYFKNQVSGEMFFGGVNGFNSFFPNRIQINEDVPPVVLTSFKIFDKEMKEHIGALLQNREIVLTHKDNFFSFEFSVLDYWDLRKNQFAYKLEGLEDEWIKCGSRRYVNYTNLDPGKYKFRVKGANSDGVWNEQGTFVNVFIKPRFYQTWWFHPTVVGLLILSIIIFYTRKIRLKIRRSLEIERIRIQEKEKVQKNIAADFHDELGQKLTKISLFSEIIKSNITHGSEETLEYINKISEAAKELASSTRDFIWTLDPVQNSLHDVILYLKDFGDELFDKTCIDFRVEGIVREMENIKLPMEWRRHFILIFKEGMNNILKHAECNNVQLQVNLNENQFAVVLSDDGIGRFQKKKRSSKGLDNMKNRAQKIGGELNIDFHSEVGTKIVFNSEIPQMGY